ncbi:MAG: twin transmembrane helix small protein [Aquisalimonadaceae bacterium]
MTLAIKIAVILALLAIIASLACGAVFLVRDRSGSKRVVRALTLRITLSVALFLVLVTLVMTGVLVPNDPFYPR